MVTHDFTLVELSYKETSEEGYAPYRKYKTPSIVCGERFV